MHLQMHGIYSVQPASLDLIFRQCVRLQAAQVRKSSFVTHEEEKSGAYHPETHHSCTVHAGTFVQQASCWAPHQVQALL